MKPTTFRQAAAEVAQRIRKGEVAGLADALIGDDLEGWLEDLAVATITKDAARVKRSLREAARRGAEIQLAIPGMDHASLPPVVFTRDEFGQDVAVPIWLATKAQIRRETGWCRGTRRPWTGWTNSGSRTRRRARRSWTSSPESSKPATTMRSPDAVFMALLLRDGPTCYLDGQPGDDDDPLEIEHRRPRAAGGSDDLDNLALAHRSCNRTKGVKAVAP